MENKNRVPMVTIPLRQYESFVISESKLALIEKIINNATDSHVSDSGLICLQLDDIKLALEVL